MDNIERGKKNLSALNDFLSKWGTLIVFALIIILFSATMTGTFLTTDNAITVLRAISISTVAAVGVTFSLTVNGFDVSVGSTMTLASAVCVSMFVWYSTNTPVSILVALAAALLVGGFNVFLLVVCKVPDMLASLATLFIFQGISMTYAGGGGITEGMPRFDGTPTHGVLSASFKKVGEFPYIVIIMLVIVAISFVFLNYTKHGRFMYMVGGNAEAARLSGINIKKYRILAYLISAGLAGLAGIMLASRVGSASANSGGNYLMPALAASCIGFSVAGAGKANIIGTFVGAALIGVLENGLVMASLPYYSIDIVKGGVLAIALIITYVKSKN